MHADPPKLPRRGQCAGSSSTCRLLKQRAAAGCTKRILRCAPCSLIICSGAGPMCAQTNKSWQHCCKLLRTCLGAL